MPILINGEWWERTTSPWITGYRPISTYKKLEERDKEVMKILFLDVDGVLNTTKSRSLYALSKPLLVRLQKIVEETGCKIVLSSTWRRLPEAKSHLIKKLAYHDLQLFGSTEYIPSGPRGLEIEHWLNYYGTNVKYAIVDDDSDMLDHQLPHFFQTDPDHGLTETIAYRIKYHLNN